MLRKADGNGVRYDGEVSASDVCAIGKSTQRADPKTAEHNVNAPYQLVFADLVGPINPVALGGYNYVSMFTDQHSKWKEIYLLKAKIGAHFTCAVSAGGRNPERTRSSAPSNRQRWKVHRRRLYCLLSRDRYSARVRLHQHP